MRPLIGKSVEKAGRPPGTLIHVGEQKIDRARVTVIDYDESSVNEYELGDIEECFPFRDTATVTWINVDGVHDIEVIQKLGDCYGIHPLVLEDVVNTNQRPKLEEFDDYVFLVLKMLLLNEEERRPEFEQVSIILGPNFVVSFQEREGDVFESVRERIRSGKGRIRRGGADYLAYALLDSIVDGYFVVLETFGEYIEALEEELLTDPERKTLQRLNDMKREVIFLRKSVWPLREVISALQREESALVEDTTRVYLRDVYDHTIQVIDTVETFRDMLTGMLDVYLSGVSNRMNEVMKVLTIIATIFIPLTFIAGVYGMNFTFMPELGWHWGYPITLLVMVVIGILMVVFFKRKKWL
ncbi:MAG: magnesium/cobalt transporter CorA [Candidatus Coatesbacteria bacterium]|nr:MAG: magnesium/cobalt transporter CorA [Candidatus Coatesbacteria bacterium]